MNARLARTLGSPIWAAAFSGLVLTVALTLVAWALFRGGPRTAGLTSLPWWAWAGGFGGGTPTCGNSFADPSIGCSKSDCVGHLGADPMLTGYGQVRPAWIGASSCQHQARDRSRTDADGCRTYALADSPSRVIVLACSLYEIMSATFNTPLGATMLPNYVQTGIESFKHSSVVANGTKLHFVVAGSGDPVLLLPGWPQHWYAWRHVMLRLIGCRPAGLRARSSRIR